MLRVVMVLLCCWVAGWSDIVVVVSENSPIGQLDEHQVKRIFLDKIHSLSHVRHVEPVEGSTSPLRKNFYKEVTGKSEAQLRSYWAKQVFTGRGKPPRKVRQDQLAAYLAQNPDAISYISSDQVTGALKIVYRVTP